MAALPDAALELNSSAAQLLLRAARDPTQAKIATAFADLFTHQQINHALWLLTVERPEPTALEVARLIGWGANTHYRPDAGQPMTLENLDELGMTPLLQILGIS